MGWCNLSRALRLRPQLLLVQTLEVRKHTCNAQSMQYLQSCGGQVAIGIHICDQSPARDGATSCPFIYNNWSWSTLRKFYIILRQVVNQTTSQESAFIIIIYGTLTSLLGGAIHNIK